MEEGQKEEEKSHHARILQVQNGPQRVPESAN